MGLNLKIQLSRSYFDFVNNCNLERQFSLKLVITNDYKGVPDARTEL